MSLEPSDLCPWFFIEDITYCIHCPWCFDCGRPDQSDPSVSFSDFYNEVLL